MGCFAAGRRWVRRGGVVFGCASLWRGEGVSRLCGGGMGRGARKPLGIGGIFVCGLFGRALCWASSPAVGEGDAIVGDAPVLAGTWGR